MLAIIEDSSTAGSASTGIADGTTSRTQATQGLQQRRSYQDFRCVGGCKTSAQDLRRKWISVCCAGGGLRTVRYACGVLFTRDCVGLVTTLACIM
jgi:hypothetical protein